MTSNNGVLVALSGGVDSSVCVRLLQEQGFSVQAAVIAFSPAHQKAVEAARESAELLGVPLHILRCHALFEEAVIRPFANSYLSGKTPNPCILCNPLVKFQLLTEEAERLSLPYIATGHYAGVKRCGSRYAIQRAACAARDQSYMLYRLTQRQLEKLILPLAGLDKAETRQKAAALALPCAGAPDSQEICFIEDGDYPSYIEEHYGRGPCGHFISPEGKDIGPHRGITHYTVGQRKGLGVALGRPVCIRYIDPQSGDIFLGEYNDVLADSITLEDCVWQPFEAPGGPLNCQAKIRSQAKAAPCLARPLPDGRVEVEFSEPQRAPTPGQSCVLYEGDTVLGGGFIQLPALAEGS